MNGNYCFCNWADILYNQIGRTRCANLKRSDPRYLISTLIILFALYILSLLWLAYVDEKYKFI